MSGATAAAVIAAQKKRLQDQEEEMTKYTEDSLNDWELKILRAYWPSFKNLYELKKALDEESKAGWVFLEKFDDNRIRLKRKISERIKDEKRTIDPYRTVYGMSTFVYCFLVMGITIAVSFFFVFLIVLLVA